MQAAILPETSIMNVALPDFLADSVHIDMCLPFRWLLQDADSPPPAPGDNLATLQLVDTLEESVHVPEVDRRTDDVQRLEQKIDLALQLLGRLLASQAPQALPLRRIVLGCRGLAWHEDQPLPAGRSVQLLLKLHTDAMPLRLGGKSVAAAAGAECNCLVRFDPLDAEFENRFEKWIFRQHRRAIARQRARA